MKARSMWNPWAIFTIGTRFYIQIKNVETTRATTSYRGPLLIASTRVQPLEAQQLSIEEPFATALKNYGINTFNMPNGYLLGIRYLVDIKRTEEALAQGLISDQEMKLGDYSPDRHAWFFSPTVYVFKTRIPVKGKQMLWEYDQKEPIECYVGCQEKVITLRELSAGFQS